MEFGDSGAVYTAFSRPVQMAFPATCLSVIAQRQTKNSLVVKGQTRDAGVIVTAFASVAELLHKPEHVRAVSARSFPGLPFSCSVQ